MPRNATVACLGLLLALALFLLTMPHAQGQSFDVASIRPSITWSKGGEGSTSRSEIEYDPTNLALRNINLEGMIQWAYALQPFQISAPNKLPDERYDVRAKSEAPVSLAQMRVMLQDLLATRFKLTVRREPKKTSVFELVVAKGGPKLSQDKSNELPVSYARENLPRVADGDFIFTNTSLAEFAEQLSQLRPIGQPVLDRTGIQGSYHIRLKGAASAILQTDGPSLFTLVEQQLGLKLVAAKDVVPILIVDHDGRPSEN